MREKERSTTLIFVRHGHTDFPADRIYCDQREDPPLSALGVSQIATVPTRLVGMPITAIYSSPTARTMATARPLADAFGVPVVSEARFRERAFGIWDGLYFHEIEQQYPDHYQQWKRDNTGFTPEGGESIYMLRDRLLTALREVLSKHRGESVAVVSHVGPIRVAVAEAIELPVVFYRRLVIDNASVSAIAYGRTQNNLLYLNRC